MFIKNKFVSLCKGQNQGESSPYSNVLKNIMSPCSVQNRVSPDYVSTSCADKSMDLILNKNNSIASSAENAEVAFFVADDKKMIDRYRQNR